MVASEGRCAQAVVTGKTRFGGGEGRGKGWLFDCWTRRTPAGKCCLPVEISAGAADARLDLTKPGMMLSDLVVVGSCAAAPLLKSCSPVKLDVVVTDVMSGLTIASMMPSDLMVVGFCAVAPLLMSGGWSTATEPP